MSSSIVSIVYRSVINDVIENVKKDFEDFGDDGTILAKLKRTWEDKIKSAKVATWDQNDVAVGEECGQSSGGGLSVSTPFLQPPPQNESIPKGPSGQDYDTPAANLAILATNTIMSDNNGVGRPQHFLSQAKNGNGISLPSTTATDNIARYVYGNSQTEALQMSQNNAFLGQPASYMQTMGNKQEIDMHEQKLKENGTRAVGEVIQNAPTPPPQQPSFDSANRESRLNDSFAEEDVINSDLDDSDDEGAAEGDEIQNIILCLYDKVTRTKNKWKCQLKDGVMSVNGKDFLFQKGNGDFEF